MSNIFRKQGINTGSGGGSIDTSALANKTDLTAIILTGTTNTSGDIISAGTWFYLNGKPCVAKVDIASGATFTDGTNYEEKTIGSALSELNAEDISNGFFTPTHSSIIGSGAHATKIGNLIVVSISMSVNTTITYSKLGNINSNYAPLYDMGLSIQGYSSGNANGGAIATNYNNNASIYGTFTPVSGGVIISGCYVCQ